MAGSTTDVGIASNALILLGHQPIASFTEPTAGAEVASNLFETTYQALLTSHRWRFASKQAVLSRLTATPIHGFNYQFQLPIDIIYLTQLVESADYEIYGDKLYTNSPTATIDYTYNVAPDKLPAYYIKALEFLLASQFAVPVTGDIDKAKLYHTMYLDQLRKAKFADSTQRPQDTFMDSPYTDVRG